MPTRKLPRPDLWAGAIMTVILLGTALVSPLYPIYQAEWGLSANQVAQLYVIYIFGALLSLLVFGRLTDQLGYTRVMAAALMLALIGGVMSLLANDFYMFSIARFLVGIATSLITTSGSVAVIVLTPAATKGSGPLMSSLFILAGFALGPVMGGVVGQLAPQPLIAAHLPSLALMLAALVVFCFLPKQDRHGAFAASSLIPRLSWTTRQHALKLSLALCLPFICFGVFGLYASLAPMLIETFIGRSGPVISGLYIATFLTGAGLCQILARKVPPMRGALIALSLMALGNGIMWVNLGAGSVWLFVAGVVIASVGHGFCLLASTVLTHHTASDQNRGALTATYWAIGYSGSIFPLLLLGWASDHWGLTAAVAMYCLATLGACLLVAALFVAFARRA